MTLLDIESLLTDRGLRLRKAVRVGRRYHVEAAGSGFSVEATGVDLEDAIQNLIAVAERRPKGRRFAS